MEESTNIFESLYAVRRKNFISCGAVDQKTHHKWVWAFIDAITELVDEVVGNHSVRTAQIVVFFVMTPCDSADAPKRIQCWQAFGNA